LAKTYTSIEVQRAIKRLKNDTAPDEDQITPELLKALSQENITHLTNIFNKIIEHNFMPHRWKHARIWSIYKSGDPTSLKNYRPISLCQTLYKIFTHVIRERITEALEKYNILSETQAGFRRGYSTHHHILTLQCIIEEAAAKKKKISLYFQLISKKPLILSRINQ
jgi:hypothetical protein